MHPDTLFPAKLTCPVCEQGFSTLRAARTRLVPADKESDFFVKYEGDVNPYYYDIAVCPNCGYAASEGNWTPSALDLTLTSRGLGQRKPKADYTGLRDLQLATQTYMLAIHSLSFRKHGIGATALMYMRLAWLYRGVDEATEQRYLRPAAEMLEQSLVREDAPPGKMSALTCEYLTGELYRRAGDPAKATLFFAQVAQNPAAKQERQIEKLAREGWQTAKEQMRAE